MNNNNNNSDKKKLTNNNTKNNNNSNEKDSGYPGRASRDSSKVHQAPALFLLKGPSAECFRVLGLRAFGL